MPKRVILVTGTPCVGKTSISRVLASKLNAVYVGLTELATCENLIVIKDKERNSAIVNEKRMEQKICTIIEENSDKDVIIDGHYVVHVVPKKAVSRVFVLRRDPVELQDLMRQRGFSGNKLWENLASEILDVCLVDALNVYEKRKVCELDVSGKTVEKSVDEILSVLHRRRDCCVGVVDWLGRLENEGLLDQFLKI